MIKALWLDDERRAASFNQLEFLIFAEKDQIHGIFCKIFYNFRSN